MHMVFYPPYQACRRFGRWYVMDARGDCDIACECRRHAEEIARDMNEDAEQSSPMDYEEEPDDGQD